MIQTDNIMENIERVQLSSTPILLGPRVFNLTQSIPTSLETALANLYATAGVE